MIVGREKRSTASKPHCSASWSTTNTKWKGLESNRGLRDEFMLCGNNADLLR